MSFCLQSFCSNYYMPFFASNAGKGLKRTNRISNSRLRKISMTPDIVNSRINKEQMIIKN